MKAKRLWLLTLLLPMLIFLVACQQTTTKTTDNQSGSSGQVKNMMTVKDLLTKVKKANTDVTSMNVDVALGITGSSNSLAKNQEIKGELIYNKENADLTKGHLVLNMTQGDQKAYQEIIMPGGENLPVYSRSSKDGKWTKQVQSQNSSYYIQPDYFKLLKALSSMSDDDLRLKEEGDDYVVSLKNQNTDLIGLFGKEFDLELTGITQADMQKELTVKFDKKNFYFKEFQLKLSYDGDKGKLEITTDVTYSSWNKVDENSITEPKDI